MPDKRGEFRVQLGVGEYTLKADAPEATYVFERFELDERGTALDVQLRPPPRATPATVTADLRRLAVPVRMESIEAESTQDKRISRMLCNARLVGVGESTHGSSEFTRLRGVLLFHLAKACGFNALLIEADMMDFAAIDDYVMTGTGDPVALVSRISYFPFSHEELLELVRAIRAHNVRAPTPIRVMGFDPFASSDALAGLLAWLAAANPALHARVAPDLAIFAPKGFHKRYPVTPDEVRARTRAALAQVRRFFDSHDAEPERMGRRIAMRLRALESVERRYSASPGQTGAVREKLLAENTRWAIEEYLPGAKAIVAAHNGHVLYGLPVWKFDAMGDQLVRIYGDAYVSLGVYFGTGSFRAIRWVEDKFAGLDNFSVGPPLRGSLEEQLDRVGLPAFLVDLRNLTEPMKGWLESEHLHRELGALYISDAQLRQQGAPAIMYDVMAYIAKVNAIVPVPRRPPEN